MSEKKQNQNYNSPRDASPAEAIRVLRSRTVLINKVGHSPDGTMSSSNENTANQSCMQELLKLCRGINARVDMLAQENTNLNEQMENLNVTVEILSNGNQRDQRANPGVEQGNVVINAPPAPLPLANANAVQPAVRPRDFRFTRFKAADCEGWFESFERMLQIFRINDDAEKVDSLITHIGHEVVDSLFGFLQTLPLENQYVALKREILSRYALSPEQKIDKLFRETGIADRKPSEILKEITKLAGNQFLPGMLMCIWRKRLPKQIQVQIVNDEDEDAVTHADKIYEIARGSDNLEMHEQPNCKPPPSIKAEFDRVFERIDSLTREIRARNTVPYAPRAPSSSFKNTEVKANTYAKNNQNRDNNANEQQRRTRDSAAKPVESSKSTGESKTENKKESGTPRFYDGVCYAHHQYGARAKSCNERCKRYKEHLKSLSKSGNA